MRIAIVGGGIVGLATAMELARIRPSHSVLVLEKENAFGLHQSTHNSGVLHAGLYYRPGSLKARLAVAGIRRMVGFCQENGVRFEQCGKLVIAATEAEIPRLEELFDRGRKNDLKGLRWLSPAEYREIEPHAGGVAAVHVPEDGIVDYVAVIKAMTEVAMRHAVELRTNARVVCIRRADGNWHLETSAGHFEADFIINCAGLYSDRVAKCAGERPEARIVPFRGEYFQLGPQARHLVRNLIYPVPDPKYPFLGVHFTRLVGGGVEAGPNAVLAFAREGYRRSDVNLRDIGEAVFFPGLWRFVGTHRGMVWEEMCRSFSRRHFCSSLQRLVPAVRESDLSPGGAGVRAQALLSDGTLVQDFSLVERPGALHVLNAPSPAATASLAIGEYVAQRVWAAAATQGIQN